MTSFFEQMDDDRFRATEHAIGPWSVDTLHGGPPAALLGRAIEKAPSETGKKVARIAFDIFKPVPLSTFDVRSEIVRPGKRVDLVEASLDVDGDTVMRASAWRVIEADHEVPATTDGSVPPSPEHAQPQPTFDPPTDPNYLTAMEWRFISGTFLEPGAATAWLRMREPLIQGEANSPLTKVLTAVDSASGISAVFSPREWVFVNVDLVVNLNRYPEGEWIGLDATTIPDRSGVGLARSTIFDTIGVIGASSQTLFIAPR